MRRQWLEIEHEGRIGLAPGLAAMIARGAETPALADGDTVIARCDMAWTSTGRRGSVATLTVGAAAPRIEADASDTLTVLFLADHDHRDLLKDWTGAFYLPEALSALVMALATPSITGVSRGLYRRAKCQELLCEIMDRAERGDLVACASAGSLSLEEMERLIQARNMIASRFDEKLTLSIIGRFAGLNRAKLTQGFREVFGQTVADCLAEHRLMKAAADLAATSRPVAVVGYSAGYLNNASFARAFSKRFGLPPSEYRRAGGRLDALPVAA